MACTQGKINIIEMLLDNGADIEVQNEDGNTPLYFAGSVQKTV